MNLRTTSRRALAAVLLCAAAGTTLAACGGEDNAETGPKKERIAGVDIGYATDQGKKPVIDIPDTLPPKTMIKKDLVVGKGAVVKTGDQLTARYVGVAWGPNKQFDASWDRPEKQIPFTLSKGSVIDGWTEGLPGMRVGGRRLLIVPPAKGYGDQAQGEDIQPNETLVFIVDAKKTEKAPAQPEGAAGGAAGAGGIDEAALQAQIQEQLQAQVQQGAAP